VAMRTYVAMRTFVKRNLPGNVKKKVKWKKWRESALMVMN